MSPAKSDLFALCDSPLFIAWIAAVIHGARDDAEQIGTLLCRLTGVDPDVLQQIEGGIGMAKLRQALDELNEITKRLARPTPGKDDVQ